MLGGLIIMAAVQLMFTEEMDGMKPYTNYTCKYCGKPFLKKHNKEMYCSDECRLKAHQDQDAEYQRRKRRRIREGVIITNERAYVGTGFLSHHKREDDDEEHAAIIKEMKRLKLI